MDMGHYILDGHKPKRVSLMEWAQWFEDNRGERQVGLARIGMVTVSTVFLGLDHQWGDGPPLLFETMIFNGANDQYQTRASTWDEAEEQHKEAVTLVRATPWYSNAWWFVTDIAKELVDDYRRKMRRREE